MTNEQIKLIHLAAKQVGLIAQDGDDARYRLMLENVGGVSTSKGLNNETFEDCMALLEDMGFSNYRQKQIDRASLFASRGSIRQSTYWRDRVARRSKFANSRMVWKLRELAKEQRYELASMVRRTSANRTDDPEQLTPKEAWDLIEGFKAIIDREGHIIRFGSGAVTLLRREANQTWYTYPWDESTRTFGLRALVDDDRIGELKTFAIPHTEAARYLLKSPPPLRPASLRR